MGGSPAAPPAKSKRKGEDSPMFLILRALDSGVALTATQLAIQVELDNKVVSQALYGMNKNFLVRRIGHAYEITRAGKTRLSNFDADAKFSKPKSKLSPVVEKFIADATQSIHSIVEVMPKPLTIRLAYFNDGGVMVERGTARLELTPEDVLTVVEFFAKVGVGAEASHASL
jgi:predicted transcriptional regulator